MAFFTGTIVMKTTLKSKFSCSPVFAARCVVVALLAGAFLLPQMTSAAEVVDRIVAVVNGKMITLSEVNQNLALVLESAKIKKAVDSDDLDVKELRSKILQKMIDDLLLEQEAVKFNIEVADSELRVYLDDFKKQNRLTDEQLVAYLTKQGMTLDSYKDKVRKNMLRNRVVAVMVQRKVVVTEEEIEEYYQQHKNELANLSLAEEPESAEDAMQLGLIVVDSNKDADMVRQKILNNEMSFAEAAKKYSVGPAASDGGDLGRVQLPDLVPELKAVVSGMQPGQVSEPFALSGKVAIIQLRQSGAAPDSGSVLSSGGIPPLEEVRDQIRGFLQEKKMEKTFSDYTQRLRDQALIDVRL